MFFHDDIEITNDRWIVIQDYTGNTRFERATLPGAWHIRTICNEHGVKEFEFCHRKVFTGKLKVYHKERYIADAHAKICGSVLVLGTRYFSAAEINDFSRKLAESRKYGRYVIQHRHDVLCIAMGDLDREWQVHIYTDKSGRVAGIRVTLCGIPEPDMSHKLYR